MKITEMYRHEESFSPDLYGLGQYLLCEGLRVNWKFKEEYKDVAGWCVDISEEIIEGMKRYNLPDDIEYRLIEGWVSYDFYESCIDRSYDEHSWVEIFYKGKRIYVVDASGEQFNYCLGYKMPQCYIGIERPKNWSVEEPKNLMLED